MDNDSLLHIDMQGAEDLFKLEQIRKILNISSQGEFAVIRWNSPKRASPDDASYVLIKQYERGIGFVCSFASYEQRQFWDLLSMSDTPIDRGTVVAWSYLPYDNRISLTGELKA